jgi:hypothetical protein
LVLQFSHANQTKPTLQAASPFGTDVVFMHPAKTDKQAFH